MVKMALMRHWKKSLAGLLLGTAVTSYLIKKQRERNVIREYCNIAKTYGEKKTLVLEKTKKLIVFLNNTANNSDAKIQFTKYAAPLLHLSGIEVTVVESEYRGHIQMLMHYIDPTTDGVVIAGGDGTIMEVLNGIMRRQDVHKAKSIVLGIIPLGKENQSFKTLFPFANQTLKARYIGDATLKIIQGLTKQVPVMEIQPEKGWTLFALSSVKWGVFKEAFKNKDRFWIFGKLRLLMSYISTALRNWPEGCQLSVWVPQTSTKSPNVRGNMVGLLQPQLNKTLALVSSEERSLSSRVKDLTGWTNIEEEVAGFTLSPGESQLSLTLWSPTKSEFIKHGWCSMTSGPEAGLMAGREYNNVDFVLDPKFQGWLSVDGEEYESVFMAIKLHSNYLTLFT